MVTPLQNQYKYYTEAVIIIVVANSQDNQQNVQVCKYLFIIWFYIY